MDIRQQVILEQEEINTIIAQHLKKNGMRIKNNSKENRRDGSFFCLLMTEDEIYIADTELIISKPLSLLELKNQKLKDKLNKNYPVGKVADLLTVKQPGSNVQAVEKFKKQNFLEPRLYNEIFTIDPEAERGITEAEEKLLIKTFGQLGITVNKKPKMD